MAARYRALLIGNSTYPADEHNLQALKGPVKDIAVLNRALADPVTGLFADADVTLLPEVSSARAIRALGRFFGDAARDDVLLFYFSGHGKLDQAGRLHLCMQDTESTELLSTAVSSARINEFADASHARNVVIVLDCCFSGAFRGGDLGDAVAGPGRYVMTSCRGTQLANDATAENSTSQFTQHLVDGLVGGAADHDGNGYVTFSELYAYVNRRLRESGKQIPQRRVQGDGDLPLARREQLPLPQAGDAPSAGQRAAEPGHASPASLPRPAESPRQDDSPRRDDGPQPPDGPQPKSEAAGGSPSGPPGTPGRGTGPARRRRTVVIAAVAVAAAAGGTVAAVLLTSNGPAGNPPAGKGSAPGTFTATAPWRLEVDGTAATADGGCTISLIDASSGAEVRHLTGSLSNMSTFQVSEAGTYRWRLNDPKCAVQGQPGTGTAALPFAIEQFGLGDTAVFATSGKVVVHVTDWQGVDTCSFGLYDPASGTLLSSAQAVKAQGGTVTLGSGGRKNVYLETPGCGASLSAGT